jgi:signal transduction histidine kinase
MPPVPLDPNLMHQALMNLMTNAVQAVPDEDGKVGVRVKYHEPGPEQAASSAARSSRSA